MNELSKTENQLPSTLPELAKFVLVGREKLTAVRAEINAIKKVGLAKEVLEQKKEEAQEIAELVTLSEVQIGKMLKEIPKAQGKRTDITSCPARQEVETKTETIRDLGFTPKQTAQFQQMADHEPEVREAMAEAREKDDIVSRASVMRKIEEAKHKEKTNAVDSTFAVTEELPPLPAKGNVSEESDDCKSIQETEGEMPILEQGEKKPFVVNNSTDNEWYTPAQYIESAREVMGSIDLDPASNDFANKTVRATEYYSEKEDGLKHEWFGNIWLNPPYQTALIMKFAEKLNNSNFNQAIVLVNNASETQWFQKLSKNATAFVWHLGRIRFEKRDGAHGSPLQGQIFLYYGDNPSKFLRVFTKYGRGSLLNEVLSER